MGNLFEGAGLSTRNNLRNSVERLLKTKNDETMKDLNDATDEKGMKVSNGFVEVTGACFKDNDVDVIAVQNPFFKREKHISALNSGGNDYSDFDSYIENYSNELTIKNTEKNDLQSIAGKPNEIIHNHEQNLLKKVATKETETKNEKLNNENLKLEHKTTKPNATKLDENKLQENTTNSFKGGDTLKQASSQQIIIATIEGFKKAAIENLDDYDDDEGKLSVF